MENEITYNEKFDLIESTTKIVYLKNQTAQNIIEIGKELIKVKNNLSHGEFVKYLENNVDISPRWANVFMKIGSEYSNKNSSSYLGVKKLFALLDVPAEEREEFVINNDIENKSVRETERLIKENKELQNYNDVIIAENNQLKNQKPTVKEVIKEVVPQTLRNQMENMKRSLENSEREYLKVQKKLKELEHLESEKDIIEKAKLEYLKLEVKMNEYNKAIEDMKLILVFIDKFDKFYHNDMMPLATIIKAEKVNESVKSELKIRTENLNNWLYAINQKFN